MMMFEGDEISIWNNDINKEKTTFKICVHCSIPFTRSDENCDNSFNFPATSFALSSSSSSGRWLVKALFSIFKLSYLNYFDNYEDDHVQEEDLWMCQNCHDLLINLCRIYEDFLHIGRIDSYLSKKLRRLDEIIVEGHHLQKSSNNCNLTAATPTTSFEEKVDAHDISTIINNENVTTSQQQQQQLIFSDSRETNFDIPITKSNNRDSSCSSSRTTTKPIKMPHLRVLLTRLPQKYLNETAAAPVHKKIKVEENDFYDGSPASLVSHEDFDGLLPFGKTAVEEEDDDHYSEAPLSDSDSSEGFNPDEEFEPVKKRNKKRKSASVSPKKNQRRKKITKPKIGESKNDLQKPRKAARISTTSLVKANVHKSKSKKESKSKKSKPPSERAKDISSKNGKYQTESYLGKKAKFPNPCWYCDLPNFVTPTEVVEHTREVHLPQHNYKLALICDRCGRICNTDGILEKHLKKCQLVPCGDVLPRKFPCDQCSKSFVTEYRLKNHLKLHKTDRPFACNVCHYRAKLAGTLEHHKMSVHTAESVSCGECGKILKNELSLRNHTYNQHTKEGHEKYQQVLQISADKKKQKWAEMTTVCVDCGGVDFFSRLTYLNHRKSVHGELLGKHTCHICGKNFSKTNSLTIHTRTHSDDRPYLCNVCGKSFKTTCKLKHHEQSTHSEEGRLRYNARIREYNRRRKLIAAQLAYVDGGGERQTVELPSATSIDSGSSIGQFSSASYHQ